MWLSATSIFGPRAPQLISSGPPAAEARNSSRHHAEGCLVSIIGRGEKWNPFELGSVDQRKTQSVDTLGSSQEGRSLMSEVRGSVVTDDGVRLAYKVAGRGPHNLLLMHGWAGSANSWNGFIRALDLRKFRAIAYDFRAHGDSDMVTMGFTDERLARDALAVANAAGARTFTAVGFSMSGRFVQYLPLLAPERMAGMVIVAGALAWAMELPEEVIADWAARAGDREKLREIPMMFAIKLILHWSKSGPMTPSKHRATRWRQPFVRS
jgi:hypothetical protein